MPAVGVGFVLFGLVVVGVPLLLYWLVRAERERDAANTTDFETAERSARRDRE